VVPIRPSPGTVAAPGGEPPGRGVVDWQHQLKSQAVKARAEAPVKKEVAEVMRYAAELHRVDVIAYFEPEDDLVITPPDAVPARPWKMSDET